MEVNAVELYKKLLYNFRKPISYDDGNLSIPNVLNEHWDYMASTAAELQNGLRDADKRLMRDFPEYLSWLVTCLMEASRFETIQPERLAYINRFLAELAEHSKYYPKKFLMAYQQGLKEGDPQWKKPGIKLPR
jgi:hypothetical protein